MSRSIKIMLPMNDGTLYLIIAESSRRRANYGRREYFVSVKQSAENQDLTNSKTDTPTVRCPPFIFSALTFNNSYNIVR